MASASGAYGRLSGLRPVAGPNVPDPRAGSSQMGVLVGGSSVGQEELNSGYNSEDESVPRPRDGNAEEVYEWNVVLVIRTAV
jgi:hypothetical protein